MTGQRRTPPPIPSLHDQDTSAGLSKPGGKSGPHHFPYDNEKTVVRNQDTLSDAFDARTVVRTRPASAPEPTKPERTRSAAPPVDAPAASNRFDFSRLSELKKYKTAGYVVIGLVAGLIIFNSISSETELSAAPTPDVVANSPAGTPAGAEAATERVEEALAQFDRSFAKTQSMR